MTCEWHLSIKGDCAADLHEPCLPHLSRNRAESGRDGKAGARGATSIAPTICLEEGMQRKSDKGRLSRSLKHSDNLRSMLSEEL